MKLKNGRVDCKLADVTRIALLLMEGMVFDTSGWQKATGGDAYPEKAAQSIVGSNVVAMLEFVRVFHGTDDDQGFTAVQQKHCGKKLTRDELLLAFRGQKGAADYYQKLEAALNEP